MAFAGESVIQQTAKSSGIIIPQSCAALYIPKACSSLLVITESGKAFFFCVIYYIVGKSKNKEV